MALGIKKFVFEDHFNPGMSLLTYGKTWTGKTWLQAEFIQKMASFDFKFGRCFTPSPASRKMYKQFVPDEFIMPPEAALLGEQVLKCQTRANEREQEGKPPENNFIFSDDCAFHQEFMRCRASDEMMAVARNYLTTRMIVIQKLTFAPPAMRGSADLFATAYENNEAIRKDIYKTWFGMISDYKLFCKVLDEATKNFGFLIVNTRKAAASRDWRECVFWYRVESDPFLRPPVHILPRNMYVISRLCKTRAVQEASRKKLIEASPLASSAKGGGDSVPVRLDRDGNVYLPDKPTYDSIVETTLLPEPDWMTQLN